MPLDQKQYIHGMAEDENGYPIPKVKVSGLETSAIQPTDMQARLVNTAVTHTGQTVAPSSNSSQSTWQLVPEGMSEFMNNLTADAGLAAIFTTIMWSEDGTSTSGYVSPTVPSVTSQQKSSIQWYPVGGAFYKVGVWNGDAAPHTCSANIKFRP